MFVCPTCNKEFNTEELIQRHFLNCWKEQHPYHQSKQAPHSENIETRQINNDIINFFKEINERRSND